MALEETTLTFCLPSFVNPILNPYFLTSFARYVCRSLVSFTPRQRYIGESAKTAETSNFKNTIGSLKRLVGRTVSDPEIAEFEKKFINAELVDVNGSVGVKVGQLSFCST